MNALVSRILVLSGPTPDPEKFAAYLASLPTGRLQEKIRDLEASQTRTGRGYRPIRHVTAYEILTTAPERTTVPAQGEGRALTPA